MEIYNQSRGDYFDPAQQWGCERCARRRHHGVYSSLLRSAAPHLAGETASAPVGHEWDDAISPIFSRPAP